MQADNGNDGTLQALRGELQEEQRRAHKRAKLGIGIRVVSIVFVLGYMSWLVGAVTKLDAPAGMGDAYDESSESLTNPIPYRRPVNYLYLPLNLITLNITPKSAVQ